MKHIIAATLLATATLMAHTGASAQNKLRATIPFDFTVGQNKLPAGTYEINYIEPHELLLSCQQNHKSVITLLTSTEEVRKNPDRLIFNKYGDQYFLSEVHGDYGATEWNFGVSKLEKRVRVEEAARASQQKTMVAMK